MDSFALHRPYSRLSGSDTLVLFLHGIQGSPCQFQYLTAGLPEDVDYMCALLPGHGGSVQTFRRSGSREWLAHFRAICRSICPKYKDVYFVGHSLGCLIGMEAAASGDAHFKAMLLIACPLKIRPTPRYLAVGWQAMRKKFPSSDTAAAAKRANSIAVRHPLELLTCAKPYASLLRMISRAGKTLPAVRASIVMIQSDRDEIVSMRSLKICKRARESRAIIVPDSGHFYYSPAAQMQIRQELAELLK